MCYHAWQGHKGGIATLLFPTSQTQWIVLGVRAERLIHSGWSMHLGFMTAFSVRIYTECRDKCGNRLARAGNPANGYITSAIGRNSYYLVTVAVTK